MAEHHCIGTGGDERRGWLSPTARESLEATVRAIAQPGKGISACDESGRTINPRFENVGVTPTEEMRRFRRAADLPLMHRGDAAAATLRRVAATPRPRR